MQQLFLELSGKVTTFSVRLENDYRPKDLHRLRIGIRRIRSLLKQVNDHKARHFRKAWGGFAAVTNQARDCDVFLKSARSMLSEAGFLELNSMFMPRVLASHQAVIEVLQSAQWQRHLAEWEQFQQQMSEHAIDTGQPSWSLEEALSKARRACRFALSAGDDRAWHKFRIALKNLRYTADACLRDAACDQLLLTEVIAACKSLQSRLGRWHDSVVQLQMLSEYLPDDADRAVAWKSGFADELEKKRQVLIAEIREALAKENLFP